MDRIIIAIPYTSIVTQTSQILSEIFGSENVLEHHSDFDDSKIEDPTLRLKISYMVLITYDVDTMDSLGAKRLRKVAKECQNYGIRVQNSVFECVLDNAKFLTLKAKLKSIIDPSSDSIRFYFMGKNWERHIETLGLDNSTNVTATLII